MVLAGLLSFPAHSQERGLGVIRPAQLLFKAFQVEKGRIEFLGGLSSEVPTHIRFISKDENIYKLSEVKGNDKCREGELSKGCEFTFEIKGGIYTVSSDKMKLIIEPTEGHVMNTETNCNALRQYADKNLVSQIAMIDAVVKEIPDAL